MKHYFICNNQNKMLFQNCYSADKASSQFCSIVSMQVCTKGPAANLVPHCICVACLDQAWMGKLTHGPATSKKKSSGLEV
ncbi:hypothetical protein GDO86_006134 [Hymenochirus boettgeri]|uniref:Uncharacterized protein n=1 Tax=Hymenochirus boettgeri TaxID=247094 RepID=A0A8T2J9I9_9PIPI|nr:hypothetical protein GDO86_006134 [Hymenochirus boettgeri]